MSSEIPLYNKKEGKEVYEKGETKDIMVDDPTSLNISVS